MKYLIELIVEKLYIKSMHIFCHVISYYSFVLQWISIASERRMSYNHGSQDYVLTYYRSGTRRTIANSVTIMMNVPYVALLFVTK